MPKRVLRRAVIVHGDTPVCAIVLPPDDDGDAYLASYNGSVVVHDPDDEYGERYVTLSGCVAVEVTNLDPAPGVGNGWMYVDGVFISPSPFPSWVWDGGEWVAPVPKPDGDYWWDEDAQEWKPVAP